MNRKAVAQAKGETMKRLRTFGLALMTAALLASVGASSAAATEIYGSSGTLKSPNLDWSLKTGTSMAFTNTAGTETLLTCTESTIKATVSTGSSTTNPTGAISSMTWGKCSFPTGTTILGKLEIISVAGTTNGIVKADAEIGVTTNTVFYGSCIYGVMSSTTLGTLTGSASGPATLDISASTVKLSGSAFLCPESVKWVGIYTSTEPAGSEYVEAS
jgi:hypothetical protein